jgi:hypothetical protein
MQKEERYEPKKRVRFVVNGVSLEAERCLLLRLAEDGASRALDEILPVETVVGPAVAETSCT